MFVLNATECKILETILQRDDFGSDYNFKGLTTYEMTKNKGIAPANWSKYKDKLLYFQLVSETYERKSKLRRPRKSSKAQRELKRKFKKFKTRYYVNPIGFITLLQNLKLVIMLPLLGFSLYYKI